MRFSKVCRAILSAREAKGGDCRREQSDIEWTEVGSQAGRQACRDDGERMHSASTEEGH